MSHATGLSDELVGGHGVAGGEKKNMKSFLLVWLELLKATVMFVLTIWGTSAAAAAAHLV